MPRTPAERLALFALLAASLPAWADSPLSYVGGRKFDIPIYLPHSLPIKEVILHVSRDGKAYTPSHTVPATTPFIKFTADDDGLYWFFIQTKDAYGRLDPPSTAGSVRESLRVVVDTVRPAIKLRAVEAKEGNAAVEWEVSDANLALRTLTLEYRRADGGPWVPLYPEKIDKAHFSWNTPDAGMIHVRLSVRDEAGNLASETKQVKPGHGEGSPAAPRPGAPKVIHVKTKTFKLNYEIGKKGESGVSQVELWVTHDTQQWQNYHTYKDKELDRPMDIVVLKGDQRYGFTLRPVSGVGRGPDIPTSGQQPQLWVQVDEKPPQVTILDVRVGEGADAGFMTVTYRATDEFLREKPITVLTSATKDGEYKAVEEQPTANTGTLRLKTEGKGYQFFLRVEAIDEAGNKGSATWPEAVKVDLVKPEVKILGVDGVEESKPAATPPVNDDKP